MQNNRINFLDVGFACDLVRQDAYGQWMLVGMMNPISYYKKFPIEHPIGKNFCAVVNVNCEENFTALIESRLVDENGNNISECFSSMEFNGCQDGMIVPLCYLKAEIQKPQSITLQVKSENDMNWKTIQKFEFRQFEEETQS